MAGELAGQVAIVTGGGRGIGRAIAQALAAAGAAVAVTARSPDQLADTVASIEQAGGQALAVPADVADQQAVEQMVATVEQQLGPVSLLVNNAGAIAFGPLWEIDPDLWWRIVEVNLRGTFLVSRAVLPGMLGRRHGRIINLSGGGASAPVPEWSAYASSKAAILRLTDTLALETAEHGIRVFALNPGFVTSTEMGRQTYEHSMAARQAGKYGARAQAIPAGVPPEPAGAACVFLASGRTDGLSGRNVWAGQDLAGLAERAEDIREKDLYVLRLRR